MNLNIELSREQLDRLQNKARYLKTSPEQLIEDLVRAFADDVAGSDVDGVVGYVLRKNQELYERLAR
jgi:hypothetical protein